ncbi:ATP-binding protein [Sideroxydans sp. CL21]|uniref:ATP-binding protein n=1 Tax=Sideroxydans sp. CL21 TaxID=2600596 RepID=UPI0024BD097B|nr:ATP-binding protein [Sideroxydans sp. CL21]
MLEMRGRGSLKQRLLVLALATVLLVWIAAAAFTYFDAREEFGEILDAHLAQSAALIVVQAHDFDEVEAEHTPLLNRYAHRVAFQVWTGGRVLRLHSANAPEEPLSDVRSGFSDKIINGQRWRVFSTWDDSGENLIHVAELTKERDELSGAIAGNLLKPLLFSLPLLAILLWLSVTRSLRPLVRLTSEVAQREPDNLAPLEVGTAPREVAPLIARLNKLFIRIDASMQKERRFTADAAHELRTPVAGIKAQAQVARTASTDAERIRALDNAILGCDRAAHLIDQLLTLARIDTLGDETTEPCQLRAIAAEVIAAIAPAALNQNVRLELTEGAEATVRGNPLLLRIMLRNLIDNAVRHTTPGTSVLVKITQEQGRIFLSVSDNGPGIPEAELEKVAERFYRPLGTSASGSGLGLSIVKRIAEIHASSLQLAQNEDGNGLRVTVTFTS